MSYPKNLVFKYPSGAWGFVGRVDVRLNWINKDGTPLTAEQASRLASASNPGMLARVRVYATKQDAINEARRLGIEYTDQNPNEI